MASIAPKQPGPDINRVLGSLRRRLRGYILLEGIALVLVVAGVLFWLSVGIDWGYFQLSLLELPQGFRRLFGVFAIGLFVFGVITWIVARLLKRMRAKALALVLERQFPELDDRLVTAVELTESGHSVDSELTRTMLDRTVIEAQAASSRLRISEVFNFAPLVRNVLLAILLVGSVIVFATMFRDDFQRWQNAFLGMEETYWDRETRLETRIVVPNLPGTSPSETRSIAVTDGVYRHPRGSDLNLEVVSPNGSVDPEIVELIHRQSDGSGKTIEPMSTMQAGSYRHVLPGLQDSITFRIRGNDYIDRQPVEVKVVDPPQIVGAVLQADFPEYTGLNDEPLAQKIELSTYERTLVIGTKFELTLSTNKPIDRASLQIGGVTLVLSRAETGELLFLPENSTEPTRVTLPQTWVAERFPESGPESFRKGVSAAKEDAFLSVPFQLVSRADYPDRLANWSPASGEPLPIDGEAGDPIRVFLEDNFGVVSPTPFRRLLRGQIDTKPTVSTELVGVRDKITSRAMVPVAGQINDDFGIYEARFEFQTFPIDDFAPEEEIAPTEDGWEPRELNQPPVRSGRLDRFPKEMVLGKLDSPLPDESTTFERFNVSELKLADQSRVILSVAARDGNDQIGRSKAQTFTIVPDGELLGLIYADQISALGDFQAVYNKVRDLRDDLVANQRLLDEADDTLAELNDLKNRDGTDTDPSERKALEDRIAALNGQFLGTVDIGLHNLRNAHRDSMRVEDRLKSLLFEMQNNQIDDRTDSQELRFDILQPLARINGTHNKTSSDDLGAFEDSDLQVGNLLAAQEIAVERELAVSSDVFESLNSSVESLDSLLRDMQAVLEKMDRRFKLKNMQKLLQVLINDQKKIRDKTSLESLKKLTDGEGLDDLIE